MKKLLLFIFIMTNIAAVAQPVKTPAEDNGYSKPSSYREIVQFIEDIDKFSELVSTEVIGRSVEGRNIYALKFSKSGIRPTQTKIKILIQAQQHGNEQSGKEGALLLAKELIKPQYSYLFDKIDLVLVPQVNPDGSELNVRRNSNKADLNRNHLIMTEPEVIALHALFDKYLFEVTMDVHEYYPYSEDWIKAGYRKNSDVLIGFNTNPQISASLRDYQKRLYMPFWSNYMSARGVSYGMYSPGGPTEDIYVRYSTFDINDGRQSYGIQNTLSFIQEGMNGEDSYVDNLLHRAYSQYNGMLALLEFVYGNCDEIKSIVESERRLLISPAANEKVALQMVHTSDGTTLKLPVYSYFSKSDSVIQIKNFRPVVKPTISTLKPLGYLIPKSDSVLMKWVSRVGFKTTKLNNTESYHLEQISLTAIDSIDFEGDIIPTPKISTNEAKGISVAEQYLFIPTAQLKGNMLVIALEPQSELGLGTYSQFGYLMKPQTIYPVIRVFEKKIKYSKNR